MKFSEAPRRSAPRPATSSPSAPATRSPLRSVGSSSKLDRRQAELVLAVAGASRHDLGAIAERVRQFGIGLAARGGGAVDIAAIDHFGFARRAEAVARGRPAFPVGALQREIAAVAGAYAIGLAAAIGGDPRRRRLTLRREILRTGRLALVGVGHADHFGATGAAAAERTEQRRDEVILGLRGRCQRQRAQRHRPAQCCLPDRFPQHGGLRSAFRQ